MIDRAAFLKGLVLAAAWPPCEHSLLPEGHPLDIKVRALDGAPIDLAAYRGSPVLISVFNAYGAECRQMLPEVLDASERYGSRKLVVIGIDSGDSDDAVRAVRKEFALGFPIGMDSTGTVAHSISGGVHVVNDVSTDDIRHVIPNPAPSSGFPSEGPEPGSGFDIGTNSQPAPLPYTLFIDAKGNLQCFRSGAFSAAELASRIEDLLRASASP